MRLRHIILAFITLAGLSAPALTLEEAKKAFEVGDFEQALPTLRATADKEPKNKTINQMTGVALMRTGQNEEARKYLARGNAESHIYLAEIDFYEYKFDDALDRIEDYEAAMKKAKKQPSEDILELQKRIELGQSMLDRVERLEIIDSINVDREEFFKSYRLSRPSGSIRSVAVLPAGFEYAEPTTVYVSEESDNMIWARPDAEENFVLVGASRLADGTWEKPHELGDVLNEGGDANYPFLMSDGVTLYYANDGENSLGGYDIFISRYDGENYLQPQNIGMPYNSPYDDYLLAIDEINGIGWWATDRNRLEDQVTIYKFKPQELRLNYSVDEPGLASFARINSVRDTWKPDADYTELLERIENIDRATEAKEPEFYFAMPGRRVYTSLSDFRSANARRLMNEYLHTQNEIDRTRSQIDELRVRYANGQKNTGSSIIELEGKMDTLQKDLRRQANDVIRAEK